MGTFLLGFFTALGFKAHQHGGIPPAVREAARAAYWSGFREGALVAAIVVVVLFLLCRDPHQPQA
jgi:hypothetical protein